MTVLVDDARWEWRGLRWAHLVSDHSYAELHEFARRLGKRRLGFQGDHYDVDEIDRGQALALGASPTDSRSLVRRLRVAGLRDRSSKPSWAQLGEWDIGVDIPDMSALNTRVGLRLGELMLDTRAARAALFEDEHSTVLLLDLPPGTEPAAMPHPEVVVSAARADGWCSVEIIVAR